MEHLKPIIILALFFTANVNASVFNTLNNVDYEWLEFSETVGLSRDQVQDLIDTAKPGDVFYEYEYASRELVEDLLLSYVPAGTSSGFYGGPAVISGVSNFLDDFGILTQRISSSSISKKTVDGYTVNIDKPMIDGSRFLYGDVGECSDITNSTCDGYAYFLSSQDGTTAYTEVMDRFGWSSTAFSPHYQTNSLADKGYGSLLVKTAVVPIPAAIWLFSSGLIGFLAFARRKHNYNN